MEELSSDEEFVEADEERQPQYDSDGDEIPDVDDINIDNKNNRANCINSNIDKVTKYLQVGPNQFDNINDMQTFQTRAKTVLKFEHQGVGGV